jgi:uncharacterized protein with NRDE domain
MCLILFAHRVRHEYPTVLVANRDEFYERPTAPLGWWPDHPNVLAGRDLRGGGTWMGVSRDGRWAGITNVRRPGENQPGRPSRGAIVADYLKSQLSAVEYLDQLSESSQKYNGFNLLIGDATDVFYFGNRENRAAGSETSFAGEKKESPQATLLGTHASAFHGLSNDRLDSPWPKTNKGLAGLKELCDSGRSIGHSSLLRIVTDRNQPMDSELPDTGVGLEKERMLAPIFIASPNYGTRCSTSLAIDSGGRIQLTETTWPDETTRQFEVAAIRH